MTNQNGALGAFAITATFSGASFAGEFTSTKESDTGQRFLLTPSAS